MEKLLLAAALCAFPISLFVLVAKVTKDGGKTSLFSYLIFKLPALFNVLLVLIYFLKTWGWI